MIKVNQIRSVAQARRLLPRIDMAGVCVGLDVAPAPPFSTLDEARAIRAALPDLPFAVALSGWAELPPRTVDDLLLDLGGACLELTPVDPRKTEEAAAERARLEAIRAPKIANGFFIQPDDLSFAEDPAPYTALRRAGVDWFQLEISSALGAGPRLERAELRRLDVFFADVPLLVTDRLTALDAYPLASGNGFFFNLEVPEATRPYDGTELVWAESQLLRLLPRR